jgi:hypothetical protein
VKLVFMMFFAISMSLTGFESKDYSFVRIFEKAATHPDWKEMTLSHKLLQVRKVALKQKTVSDPVSARYMITAYGGPIDLVHFLKLASDAFKDINMKERLYKEWKQEGGAVHQNGFNPSYPSEAHPDDLPSNALGALFGRELKEKKGEVDLLASFKTFVKVLKPLPDSLSQKFSHRRVVMGLLKKADTKTENSRYIWFTAEPLNLTALYNSESLKVTKKTFCKELKSGAACLAQAGLRIVKYRNLPILIERY